MKRDPRAPSSVAVLASGSGTNFQSLVDRFGGLDAPSGPGAGGGGGAGGDAGPGGGRRGAGARVALLVAGGPHIGALDRAERAGVPATVLPPRESGPEGAEREAAALHDALREAGADLVVLAGWLRLVPAAVVRAYWGRMVNIHPALLPAFGGEGMYGRRVHRAVIESGARVSGATVHFVDERYDRGPIVAQWPVPVREGDDAAALAARVLEVEHVLLPAVVEAIARGWVSLDEGGRVRWTRPWFGGRGFRLPGAAGAASAALAPALAGAGSEDPDTREREDREEGAGCPSHC